MGEDKSHPPAQRGPSTLTWGPSWDLSLSQQQSQPRVTHHAPKPPHEIQCSFDDQTHQSSIPAPETPSKGNGPLGETGLAHFWHYFRGLDTATSSKHHCLRACRAQTEQGRASQFEIPQQVWGTAALLCDVPLSQPPAGSPWSRARPNQATGAPGTAPLTFCLGFLGLLLLYLLFLTCGIAGRVSPAGLFPGSLQLLVRDSCGPEPRETRGSRSRREETAARQAKGSSLTSPQGCSVPITAKPPRINDIEGFIATFWLVPHSLSCSHSLTPQEGRRDFYCSALAVNSRSG